MLNTEDSVRESRIAQLIEFLKSLGALPQFLPRGMTLVHGLSGCIVSIEGTNIQLCWTGSYPGKDERKTILETPEQFEKYMALMSLEASMLQQRH